MVKVAAQPDCPGVLQAGIAFILAMLLSPVSFSGGGSRRVRSRRALTISNRQWFCQIASC